jgi:hypothetical protein
MGSQHPSGYYDEQSLRAIEGVLGEVWETLAGTIADQHARDGLRTAVITRLLDLVEQGINDPEELRLATLTHFNGRASP